MLRGKKRVEAIRKDLSNQILGRAWNNVLEKARGKEMNRKEFNRAVNAVRLDGNNSSQILDIFITDRRVKKTKYKIKIP